MPVSAATAATRARRRATSSTSGGHSVLSTSVASQWSGVAVISDGAGSVAT